MFPVANTFITFYEDVNITFSDNFTLSFTHTPTGVHRV